jgi:hypothetical protein
MRIELFCDYDNFRHNFAGLLTARNIRNNDDEESVDEIVDDVFPFVDEFGGDKRDCAHNQRYNGKKFHKTQQFHFHAAFADFLIGCECRDLTNNLEEMFPRSLKVGEFVKEIRSSIPSNMQH